MYDVHQCPECGATNTSKPDERFREIDKYHWKCFRCGVISHRRSFDYLQGPSHDIAMMGEE